MLPSSDLFMVDSLPLAFNLSNRVTDTLESSTIQTYLIQVKGVYTQKDCVN
jgi:hypothetical protein